MPAHPGRSGHAWRKASAAVLKHATHCYLCGGELDFMAPPRSPLSPSVDHVVPISHTRHLDMATQRRIGLDPANLRPAHYGCNSRRGDGTHKPPVDRTTSRNW